MLLGVSRQAVSKWEAERAYPEMDKLIKICQLFDCSLDDLVQGDLTHTTPAPQTVLPSTTQNQDVVGWDEHMRKFARTIAIGIFAAIFGFAIAAFIDGSISRVSSGDFWPGLDFSDPFAFIACCIGALVALACFIPTGIEHAAFNKAHPYIKNFYTDSQRAHARRQLARGVIVGIGIILLAVASVLLMGKTSLEPMTGGVFLTLLALGVSLISYCGMMSWRTNLDERNKSIAETTEVDYLANSEIDDTLKEGLVARNRQSRKVGAICGIIMIVATIVALGMLFGPIASAPNIDSFNPIGTTTTVFWMPWVVGGLLCGIVDLIFKAKDNK